MVEGIKVGAHHLELRFDFQAAALARALDNVEATARHAKVHIFAVAHFDVQPIDTGSFQLFYLRAQHRIIGPKKPSGNFALLANFSNGVAHLNFLIDF